MILAIDIGNSSVKAGLFNKDKLVFTVSCPVTSKSLSRKLLSKLKSKAKSNLSLTHAGISSVVPKADKFWIKAIKDEFKIKPILISGSMHLPVKIKANNQLRLGADRICNAVGVYELFKRKENVIAIDFGTATTYDVVLKNGDYLGGIIAPGITASAYALKLRTSKLPKLNELKDFVFPQNLIGKSTLPAMQSGIMYSSLYSVEGIIYKIQTSTKKKFKIVLTGGLARSIHNKTKYKTTLKENLVLYGINYILKK